MSCLFRHDWEPINRKSKFEIECESESGAATKINNPAFFFEGLARSPAPPEHARLETRVCIKCGKVDDAIAVYRRQVDAANMRNQARQQRAQRFAKEMSE